MCLNLKQKVTLEEAEHVPLWLIQILLSRDCFIIFALYKKGGDSMKMTLNCVLNMLSKFELSQYFLKKLSSVLLYVTLVL